MMSDRRPAGKPVGRWPAVRYNEPDRPGRREPAEAVGKDGATMDVLLPYGTGRIVASVPDSATVLEPRYRPGLPDEWRALEAAMRNPRGTPPLAQIVRPSDRVAIVTADITRPMPNDRVLPPLLALLAEAGVPDDHIVLVNGTGTHRANTPDELRRMYGQDVVHRYRIVNHDAYDDEALVTVGRTAEGVPIELNRAVVEADRRIVTGFIEPHFFAGFSGGAKGLFPAVAGIRSIMAFHDAHMIGHPRATWGVLDGNPLQAMARAAWELVRPDFLLNVTLNRERAITGVFAGSLDEAFPAGVAEARAAAMTPVPEPFDIVLTTNNGYPLDQNLYQAVKGMAAAAEIVKPGGIIIAVAECRDGLPSHGKFAEILRLRDTPEALLALIESPGFHMFDQWEAQKLAMVRVKADVILVSSLPADTVRAALLEPAPDVATALRLAFSRRGAEARLAVLPEGPVTIPYLAASAVR
jgi:nickel-dependent lactate racemase